MASINTVTGLIFHSKLRELVPKLPDNITKEVIEKLCDEDCTQPFLQWFVKNISSDNILSDGCAKMAKHVKKHNAWLTDAELDAALHKETYDCPELLKLLDSDYWNCNQSLNDYASEKELYDPDLEYYYILEDSLRKLREFEDELDSEIIKEDELIKKEEIKISVCQDSCSAALDEIYSHYRQIHSDVELLANTYIDAVKKNGEVCLWSQIPVELLTKQMDMYSDYLQVYTKRQLTRYSAKDDLKNRSEILTGSFMTESYENEKLSELVSQLLKCETSLYNSKLNEIIAKGEEIAFKSMANYIIDIYNEGNLKIPQTPVHGRAEIAELTKNRDFLEQNLQLIQKGQLVNVAYQFAKSKVNTVLEEEAKIKLLRKTDRLKRLEKVLQLANVNGHSFSELIVILMQLQKHQINEMVQFVKDARHHLSMEYNFSVNTYKSMQQLQDEYSAIMSYPKDQNVFNRIFTEMAGSEDSKDVQALKQMYDDFTADNCNKLQQLFEEKLPNILDLKLERNVITLFNDLVCSGPTYSLKIIPCHIQDAMYKTKQQIEDLEENVKIMRNKLTNMMKDTSEPNFEREKLILWQTFLADPDALQARFHELESLIERSNLCQFK